MHEPAQELPVAAARQGNEAKSHGETEAGLCRGQAGLRQQSMLRGKQAAMRLAGIDRLPIESHVLQAFVTESLKPFIDTVVTFGMGHFYMSQSDKGGLIYGGDLDGYNSYAQRGNLPVLEEVVSGLLEMFPSFRQLRLMRQWAGIVDVTPDSSPILGESPLPGLFLNCGWGTGGFKAIPAGGTLLAHLLATGRHHDISRPFHLDRFVTGRLIDEAAGSGIAH